MRWDDLFDDLEGQLEQELDAEQLDLLAEEERLRVGRVGLRDRIMALSRARPGSAAIAIRIRLSTNDTVTVQPTTFGKDWLAADLFGSSTPTQCILPFAAIASMALTASQVQSSLEVTTGGSTARLVDRIGLAFVLRDLCRRRTNIELITRSATQYGTIDRVGRDHLDLAAHEPGTSRRETNVVDYRIIPLETIVLVRL
jgi:hypothetical protein